MADNIRIIRLHGGEDIVADCLDDDGFVILDSPMHLIFKRNSAGGKIMVLLPWLPVELIHENIATISYKDILMFLPPRKELIEYYKEMVQVVNEQMTFSLNIGNSSEQENDVHSELLQRLLEEAIEEKKNSNIH
jgi:hypothetical protein